MEKRAESEGTGVKAVWFFLFAENPAKIMPEINDNND